MAIVSDILYAALRKCGVRDTENDDRVSEALSALNLMLESWGEEYIVPTTESFTLTAGTSEYTIGSGGDFETTRPMSIESAFIRSDSGIDYELDISMGPIDYDRVGDKDASERPESLYYAAENNVALGKIYFDSAPASAEDVYLTMHQGFSEYTAITDTVVQPPEFKKAMVYNLAVDLAEEYAVQLLPTVLNQAVMLKMEVAERLRKPPLAEFDGAILRRY